MTTKTVKKIGDSKKTQKKQTCWQKYVAKMRRDNPKKNLKELLQNYDKAAYKKFKESDKKIVDDQ